MKKVAKLFKEFGFELREEFIEDIAVFNHRYINLLDEYVYKTFKETYTSEEELEHITVIVLGAMIKAIVLNVTPTKLLMLDKEVLSEIKEDLSQLDSIKQEEVVFNHLVDKYFTQI
jgi:hypothetical protein